VWWLCTSYLFIDASIDEGNYEEEVYEEEGEHFDTYTNQGKLTLLASFCCLQDYTIPSFILLLF
jgi:hypothetical protein